MVDNLKFGNSTRRAALALRIKVQKVKEGKHPLPTVAHRELDKFLSKILKVDKRYFNESLNYDDHRFYDLSNGGGPYYDLTTALKLDKTIIGLSGAEMQDVLRACLHELPDVSKHLEALKEHVAERDAETAALPEEEQAEQKRRYRSVSPNEHDLWRAVDGNKLQVDREQMAARVAAVSETLPDVIQISDDLYAERAKVTDKSIVSDIWADGYELTSPFLYKAVVNKQRINSISGRRDDFDKMVRSGCLFILKNASDEICGTITAGPAPADNTGQINWHVGANHRGKGIATMAATKLMGRLFEAGIESFEASALLANKASLRVMEKLGFEAPQDFVSTGTDFDWIDMTVSKERFLELRTAKALRM